MDPYRAIRSDQTPHLIPSVCKKRGGEHTFQLHTPTPTHTNITVSTLSVIFSSCIFSPGPHGEIALWLSTENLSIKERNNKDKTGALRDLH